MPLFLPCMDWVEARYWIQPLLFFLFTAISLTFENINKVIGSVDWRWLCYCLYVPGSKRQEIQLQNFSNENWKRALVEWWLLTDPKPSWRRLLQRLDYCSDLSCGPPADNIRHNAEPVQGMLSVYIAGTAGYLVWKFYTLQLIAACGSHYCMVWERYCEHYYLNHKMYYRYKNIVCMYK